MSTVAERLATALANHADEVFGLLGNGNAFLIDAMLRRTKLRFTAVRHEAATVASADAYYRATRKLAVATTTYGAGFTNTITALAEASMARTPMLVVVGDAPTTGARPWDLDQTAIARACTVDTVTVRTDFTAAAVQEAALRAFRQRRPVLLALPYDLPTAPAKDAEQPDPRNYAPNLCEPNTTEITELTRLLSNARRPVILAGRGALTARKQLTTLADQLGAITVTTAPARGMFPGRTLDGGVCGGFCSQTTSALLRQADVVLAVGAGLNQFTMGFDRLFPQATLAQIDLAEHATHPTVTTYVRSDARLAIEALARELNIESTQTWPDLEHDRVAAAQFDRPFGRTSSEPAAAASEFAADGLLDPRALSAELDRSLPEQRLLVSDGGHFIGWANTYLRVPGPDSVLLVGTGFQSIGLGLAAAPGAAVAANETGRMLTVVTGDGGGLMGLADLDSVVRCAERATVVVFNDAAYTAEVTQYGSLGLDQQPMLIDRVSFAKLGEGVGARGTEVNTLADLADWRVWAASGAPGTWVLDCRISNTIVAPYQLEIMENLKRAAGR